MRKINWLVTVLVLLCSNICFAAAGGANQQILTVGVNAVPLTASQSARTTLNLPVFGFNQLTMQIDYTHSSATSLTLSCQASVNGTTFGPIQVISLDITGTGTLLDYSMVKSVSMNTVFIISLGMNYQLFKCSISGAGAGAGDLVTISAIAGTKTP